MDLFSNLGQNRLERANSTGVKANPDQGHLQKQDWVSNPGLSRPETANFTEPGTGEQPLREQPEHRPPWVRTWVWGLQGSRPESGNLQVWVWVWELQGSREKPETSWVWAWVWDHKAVYVSERSERDRKDNMISGSK